MKSIIEDATRSLVFEVTVDDIDNACKLNKNDCVLARALKALPGIRRADVGSTITRVYTGLSIKRYRTPRELRVALQSFDQTGEWPLVTGIYTLLPPDKRVAIEAIRRRADRRGPKRGIDPKTGKPYISKKKRVTYHITVKRRITVHGEAS